MSNPTGPTLSTIGPCGSCGVDNPSAARFCMACGAEIVRSAAPASGLRFVSVVFCDVVGSTVLATALEPDRWAAVLDGYFTLVGSLVESYGGKVEKFIGDAVVAVFGVDGHGESAAATAVAAASAIVRGTGEYAAGLGELLLGDFPVRAAVASGHVAVSARTSSFVIGSVLNRAARLQSHAPDDGVIVDLATRLQLPEQLPLRAVEPVAAKGFSQAVPAWVVSPAGAAPRPGAVGTVGRGELVGELAAAVGAAVDAPGPALIVVGGAPGVGKTRLVAETLDRGPGSATVVLRCPPVGAGLGLLACYLFLEEIEAAAHRGVDHADIAAHLTGPLSRAELAPAQDRGELGRALADALERFRRSRPLVLVIEHSEWIPEVLADLLGELTAPDRHGTVVLLVGVETPPALSARAARHVTVPPLRHPDARLLADRLLTAQQGAVTHSADAAPPAAGTPPAAPSDPSAPPQPAAGPLSAARDDELVAHLAPGAGAVGGAGVRDAADEIARRAGGTRCISSRWSRCGGSRSRGTTGCRRARMPRSARGSINWTAARGSC